MVSERRYEEMIRLLLEFTTTPGTLGVLAAHEGDNYFGFNRHGIALGIVPNKTFAGTPRMYASAVRTVVSKVETDFTVEVRLLLSFTSVGRRNALCKLVFLSSSSQMLILIRFGSPYYAAGGSALRKATKQGDTHTQRWDCPHNDGCGGSKDRRGPLAGLLGKAADAAS
jgi:hypothetical protein